MKADKQCMVEGGTDGFMIVKTDFLRDKKLSAKAMGVLAFMLSCSDEWDYSINGLANCMSDGKSAIRTAIKELEDRGYVRRERVKDPQSGLFSGVRYFIRPTRQNTSSHPLSDFPMSDNPMSDNRTQSNINQSSINQSPTCNTPLLPSIDEPEKTMNERARTGEDRGGTQGDDGGWLDYLIEKLRSEFPDKGPYKNDAYRRKEASIIAQAVEGMSPEEADGWCQRVVSAFRAKDFGKWLEASGGKGWHPSLGNVIESGDWERFSGESLWL